MPYKQNKKPVEITNSGMDGIYSDCSVFRNYHEHEKDDVFNKCMIPPTGSRRVVDDDRAMS